LQSIIELKVENFSAVKVEEEESRKRTIHKKDYSRLYHLLQTIDTHHLSNRNIAQKIEKMKTLKEKIYLSSKIFPMDLIFLCNFSFC
jgi:hypothetical protein